MSRFVQNNVGAVFVWPRRPDLAAIGSQGLGRLSAKKQIGKSQFATKPVEYRMIHLDIRPPAADHHLSRYRLDGPGEPRQTGHKGTIPHFAHQFPR